MKEEKIIMYDSPEAGRLVNVTVWEVDNPNGIIYTTKEHTARWNNCTHLPCDCGNVRDKNWLVCEDCRRKSSVERYNKLPFKEWDLKEPVCTWDGDRYFFDLDDLEEYMLENEEPEIDLLICSPIYYSPISGETVAGDSHEDWEPSHELETKMKEFNDFLKILPPHSWQPGKIRTSHSSEEVKTELLKSNPAT